MAGKFGKDQVDFVQFVVLEVTGQFGLDLKMFKQLASVTGVLSSDQHRFAQNAHRTRRHVLQIADRRCDQVERSHAGILSFGPLRRYAPPPPNASEVQPYLGEAGWGGVIISQTLEV